MSPLFRERPLRGSFDCRFVSRKGRRDDCDNDEKHFCSEFGVLVMTTETIAASVLSPSQVHLPDPRDVPAVGFRLRGERGGGRGGSDAAVCVLLGLTASRPPQRLVRRQLAFLQAALILERVRDILRRNVEADPLRGSAAPRVREEQPAGGQAARDARRRARRGLSLGVRRGRCGRGGSPPRACACAATGTSRTWQP